MLNCLGCLWYCKSTIFQANHNTSDAGYLGKVAVCDTAKVRFFKQITTASEQRTHPLGCLWYCKSTIFQANHNALSTGTPFAWAVCDTAKVRFFKQITTEIPATSRNDGCLWYCKSTIFQANHNNDGDGVNVLDAVCDTAKVRFFKQITTPEWVIIIRWWLFVILQKYDFSSKSQPCWWW